MTAVNVVCSPKHGRVYIATDTAIYYDDGEVAGFASKVFAIPEWSCAIMNRGAADASEVVRLAALNTFNGFDDMIAGIGPVLPRIIKRSGLKHPFELVLAGFSAKRKRPESWFIITPNSPTAPGYPAPFHMKRLPAVAICPEPNAAGIERISEDAEPDTVTQWLGTLLEVQRNSLLGAFYAIGGRAELSIITPVGIEQRTLQAWPDRVGQLIRPASKAAA
jgi:hypothetical protein